MDERKGVTTRLWIVFAFLLVSLTEFHAEAQTAGGDRYDLVFVTNLENPPGVFVGPPDTFNLTLIPGFDDDPARVRRPVAVDYDPLDGMVYWTDVQQGAISRALLDGTGEVVLLGDLEQPEGLALDVGNRLMYWSDAGTLLIERASLDGQDRSVLLNLTSSSPEEAVMPRPLVVDVANGHIFWADWGSSPKIERASTNGTSRMVLADTRLLLPIGLTLDVRGGRLYWCDAGLSLIESIGLDGRNRVPHANFSGNLLVSLDLALYHGNVYWVDYYQQIVNLTLGPPPSVAIIAHNGLSIPFGIHIHTDAFADHSCADSSPCGEGERCRQFHDRYRCVCRDGLAGRNCRLANPCSAAPCANGGSCHLSTSTDSAYFCLCPDKYFGVHCEQFDDPCTSDPCWNGGSCVNTTAEFSCLCLPEFIGSFCESRSHPYDLVFVANLNPPGIFVAPTDTFNFTLIPGLDGSHDNVTRPVAIDYDPEEDMVYWTDVSLMTLNRAFLDGTGVEILFAGLQTPSGLTLDLENRVMYWTDTGSDLIERATLDGRDRAVVLNLTAGTSSVQLRGIVVDPANSLLYWTDWGYVPKIERSGTDGAGHYALIDTGLSFPNGIALDLEVRRLYWCDAGLDRIEYSDFSGQGRTILVDLTSVGIHPFDIFSYYDFVYWSDWASVSVLRVEASGRHVGNHGSESFGRAGGIHIFKDNLPPTFTTGCPGAVLRLADIAERTVPVSWPELSASDPSPPLLWNPSHRPGDLFSVGVFTAVTYEVTDRAGNTARCDFNVTVTGVGLVCPSGVTTVTDHGLSVANVSWNLPGVTFNGDRQPVTFYVGSPPTPSTSDVQVLRVYSDHRPGDVFGVGSTLVTYRVQGLGTQCHFDVTVTDNEPPMVTGCPGDVVLPVGPSSNQAAYRWSPPIISDNAGPAGVTFGCRGASGYECNRTGHGIFAVGVTMVTYNVTDMSGNLVVCQFQISVTVVDLVCPANFTVDAVPGLTNTSVVWMEPVVTGWAGATGLNSSSRPGDVFQIGRSVVSYRQQFDRGLTLDCAFAVEVIGFCAAGTTNGGPHGRLMWPATRRGTAAESFERCSLNTPNAGQPLANRSCSVEAPPTYFQWGSNKPQICGEEKDEVTLNEVIHVEVSQGNVVEVVEFLANETSESSANAQNLEAVSAILMNVVAAGSGDTEVTALVIETVSNVIQSTLPASGDAQPALDAASSSAIVQSVESQVSLTLRQEGRVSIRQDAVHVEAVSLDPAQASHGLAFVSAPQQQQEQEQEQEQERAGQSSPQEGSLVGSKVTTLVNASSAEVPRDVIASIHLPASVIDWIQSGSGNSSQQLRASFIVYANDSLFKSAWTSGRISGSVVSLTVEDVKLANLTEPLVIQLKAPAMNETEGNKTGIKCVFWDFTLNVTGNWSEAGCRLATQTDRTVSCECTHATNFAILVDHGQNNIAEPLQKLLTIISQVGCSVSIVALAITLTVYLSIKKLRNGKSRQILIHFCFSLVMLYIVFIAGIDSATGSGGGCVFVAALLHYLTLSSMMWMAVEARNMYVSTVKVFPEDTPRYMLKACLIAWGLPLIVLTITLAAATDHYNNEDYCFPKQGLVLYIGLLAPIGLIMLHNIVTFVLVMRSLLRVKEASRYQQISKRLQNAVGISLLMGLAWGFGFLAINEAAFAFQLIFCLAVSFQGLMIFIMFCVRREEVRSAVGPYLRRACCGRTCSLGVPWKKEKSYDLQTLSSMSAPSSASTAQTGNFDLSMSVPYQG